MARTVRLSREGSHLRLGFPYDPELVDLVRALPFAAFDRESKTWTVLVCAESVRELRGWFYQGLVDRAVDDLVNDDELISCPPAVVTRGTTRRPFQVRCAYRDDVLYAQLRAIPTASWDKKSQAVSFAPTAAVALRELAEAGQLADPDGLVSGDEEIAVAFDARNGKFKIFGDERAQEAFDRHFPSRDIVAAWRDKGIDAGFADGFSAEVYAGELARQGDGVEPDGLLVPLFPYQRQAVGVALARSGFGVFDSPGLGKTATGVAWGLALLNGTNDVCVPRVVVVCPSTVRTQWKYEIERFCGHTDVVVVDGSAKKRHAAYAAAADARWLVVHFDVLHRDQTLLAPLVSGAALVVDEAHRCKNPQAKRTKSLAAMARQAERRLALTGTPVESVPDEWYHVLGLAVPGCLGGVGDFLNRYMYPSRFGGYEGARNLDELRHRSRWHFMRHTKADVAAFLPPLRVQHLVLDPEPAYQSALRRAHREARDEIRRERRERALSTGRVGLLDGDALDEIESGAEMTAVGMLRALCTSPRLVHASDSPAARALCDAGVVPDVDGPKLDEVRSIAGEMQRVGERVVIFTSSRTMANLIAERFDHDNIRYVLYTGTTSDADREIARTRFVDPQDDVTAFISTDAGAEGLNLGRCCSTLINVDIPWTPTRLEQRSNRIHRIDGTADRYLVINLTIRGTLEEGIVRMVEAKADLADAIFGEQGFSERTTGRRQSRSVKAAIYDLIDAYDGSSDAPPPDEFDEPEDSGDDDSGADENGDEDSGDETGARDDLDSGGAAGEPPTPDSGGAGPVARRRAKPKTEPGSEPLTLDLGDLSDLGGGEPGPSRVA